MIPLNSFTSVAVEGNASGYIQPFKDRNISVLYDTSSGEALCDSYLDFIENYPFDGTNEEIFGEFYNLDDGYLEIVNLAVAEGYYDFYDLYPDVYNGIKNILAKYDATWAMLMKDVNSVLERTEEAYNSSESFIAESYAEFSDAYSTLRDIHDTINDPSTENPKVEEIYNAGLNLLKSYSALEEVPIDWSELYDALESADVERGWYTNDSQAALDNAVREGYSLGNRPDVKQSDVDAAAAAIYDAINSLVLKEVLDYTEIERLRWDADYEDAYFSQGDYTYESWENFRICYENVIYYYEDYYYEYETDYTQADLNEAADLLKQAYNNLVKLDKSELTELLNLYYADCDDMYNYTMESWSYYESAFFETFMDFENQEAINDAVAGLRAARSALKRRADYSKIEQRIEEIRNSYEFQMGYYTEDSLQKFNEIAEGIVYDYYTTGQYSQYTEETEIDALYAQLETAIARFEYVPAEKGSLESAINSYEALNPTDYSEKKWAAVQEAYEKALAVFNDDSLTMKDMDTIDDATNKLYRAIEGLTRVLYDEVSAAYNTYSYIKSAIDSGDKLYSADSAAAFNEAWNKISVLQSYAMSTENPTAYTQDEVDAAVAAIEDAVKNLQELQVECYLTKAPTLTDDGTYNERSFYTDSEGKQVVVSEALLGEGKSVSFADWYLRTAVQYKDNADGSLTLRFVSMLDDTANFQEAGFTLSMGGNVLETLTTDKAYTSFVVDEKTVDMGQYSEDGGYFFISDYDYENYESFKNYVLSVESYVKTLEGDVITGNAVSFTMNDFFLE